MFNGMDMDDFFAVEKCDRCNSPDMQARITSWFNEDTICMKCKDKETEIRSCLPNNGNDLEGCGFVPKIIAPFNDEEN